MNAACLDFGRANLTRKDVSGKRVIEVGSRDVNGSLRSDITRLGPSSYLGTDIIQGPGVDELCAITDLETRYGRDAFDVVVCTEVLEHVRNWRGAISNLKRILRPGGVLLMTTRSKGFSYHGYPYDFWRYEISDIERIFGDLEIDRLEKDTQSPGVFLKAHKPPKFSEKPLEGINLYSIVTHRHSHDVTSADVYVRRLRHKLRRALARLLPAPLLKRIDRAVTHED